MVTSAQWLLNDTLLEDSDIDNGADFGWNYTTKVFSCFFELQHNQN